MLVTEIIQCKFLCCDFVHRRAGIGDCTDLISVKLFPPVKRSSDVEIHSDHPHELTMIRTSVAEGNHELLIVGANAEILLAFSATFFFPIRTFWATIAFRPRVLRVPHASNGVLPAKNFDIFNFQHLLLLSLTPHCALQAHRDWHSPHRRT